MGAYTPRWRVSRCLKPFAVDTAETERAGSGGSRAYDGLVEQASRQASKQAHTYKQSALTKQASERPTRRSADCTERQSVGTKPATADPPYACIRPASARCLARIVPTDADRGLHSGATFYNGNSRPYSAPHFAPTPNILSPASATRNFHPVPRRGGLGKGKSVAKFGADGCVWSVCGCVRAPRPRFTEKLIARQARCSRYSAWRHPGYSSCAV